ncbi:MAG: VacB/RNase II family 3'-5' exoribonuclease [Bacilli bacterium]|nr:VacB/RNase II family 3'-5' exoribonuclease [Bacilli bacterium]
METLEQLIYAYFEESKKGYTTNELRKKFKIKGEEQTDIFNSALKSLVEDGRLFFDGKVYKLFTLDLGLAYGEIEINKVGNGIIHTDYGIIFIDNENLNGALNGDRVTISNITLSKRKGHYEGKVYQIVKRRSGKLIFKVSGNGFDATLIPYNEYDNIDIVVNKNELKDLRDGDYVTIDVFTEKRNGKYYAEIDKVIGNSNTKDIDVKILFEEYSIPVEFSKEVEEEIKEIPTCVKEDEIEGRVDLRGKSIITIDCDNTKDRDDAIYVEKLPNNNYKLYVSISDVSYYVKRGTKLFEEALRRCNSHYVNNTCNPMFPKELSNGICSLNENVDRLTKTVEMEIDSNGQVVDYKIYKSVINSRKAMKYSKVNKALDGEIVEGYEEFIPQLKLMNELNKVLEKARHERNYIDFAIRDVEQVENSFGEIVDFKQANPGNAELIIENFMVIANETVAKHFYWLPFVFRVHEEPNEKAIKEILELLKLSGYKIPPYKNIDEKTLKGILIELDKFDKLDIAKSKLLKRMRRARYSVENLGHYALQLKHYCHFTSPIRRIADFIIHTIIDEVETLDYNSENISKMEKELQEVCENASRVERLSKEIEEKGMNIQMAKYMQKHIGETYKVYITELYQHAMLAKTENMIVGKISFDDMKDDKYYFDYEKNAIIGKKTNKKYRIGDKVWVIVKDANKETGTVIYEMPKQKVLVKD